MFKKTHFKTLLASVMIGSMTAISTPAMATNEAMLDLLKILKDKGSISSQEYELLVNASKADKEKVEGTASEVKAEVKKATKGLPSINTKGKLEFKQGDNKIRIGGRLMADTTFGLGDANFDGSEDGGVVSEFRRARMYLSGTWQKYWKYKFQYDFAHDQGGGAPSTAGIRDGYVAYTGFKPVTITLGHHKTPLSLEELTSSKYITFIERSQLVNGIVTDTGGGRKYAVSAKGYFGDMFTLSGAVYAGSANEDTADDQHGFTGRITFSPIHEKTRMVHLGAGFSTSSATNGGFEIDGEPEIHPGADILETESDSGGENYREADTFVLEAAGIYGPWAIQAEYASSELSESITGNRDLDAESWYVYGSYYFTGESRNYKWKKGSYSQTKVKNPLNKGGMGAWEGAVRFTSGDFDIGDMPTGSAEADILTLGLNWYPSNNIRFSANYVSVLDANDNADAEIGGDISTGEAEDAEYFVVRGQWYF